MGILTHTMNQVPTLLEFEEFTEDVEYEVVSFSGVLEFEFGFDPIEEF